MKKIFRGQVILSAVYTVTAIVVFLYTLVFMTEYNDLFGLKMPQNKQIAQFYEVILQGFNRQILVWAIVGIIGILMIVLLEIRTAVPDRFAAAVMTVYMGCCCATFSPSGRITRDWIFSICTLTESPGMNSNLLRFRWVSGYIVCRLLSA